MKNSNSNRDPTREASRDIVDIILARPKERRSAPRAAQRPSRHGYRSRVFEPVRGAQMRDGRGIDGARAVLSLSFALSRGCARDSHRILVCICSTDDASRRHLSRPAHLCVVHVLCPLGHQRRRGRSESAHGHGARSSVVFVVARPVPSRGEEKRREERRRGLTVRAFVRVRRAVRAG